MLTMPQRRVIFMMVFYRDHRKTRNVPPLPVARRLVVSDMMDGGVG